MTPTVVLAVVLGGGMAAWLTVVTREIIRLERQIRRHQKGTP